MLGIRENRAIGAEDFGLNIEFLGLNIDFLEIQMSEEELMTCGLMRSCITN